jgi:hypothetical protein
MVQAWHVLVVVLLLGAGFLTSKCLILSSELEELKNTQKVKLQDVHYSLFHNNASTSAFDIMVRSSYETAIASGPVSKGQFNLSTWDQRSDGGLNNNDRTTLVKYYSQATSVFEYGLGESTKIASLLGIPRYAGIDSDPAWVGGVRDVVQPHFRFYFADIGKTGNWGYPVKRRFPKAIYDYEIMPLEAEMKPFDVYLIDGRYRLPCLLASALHSSHRGGDPAKTYFMLHDCLHPNKPPPPGVFYQPQRKTYHDADHLFDMVDHSGYKLCVFQRGAHTTDEQLLQLWKERQREVDRL